jgi:hypothetical protein
MRRSSRVPGRFSPSHHDSSSRPLPRKRSGDGPRPFTIGHAHGDRPCPAAAPAAMTAVTAGRGRRWSHRAEGFHVERARRVRSPSGPVPSGRAGPPRAGSASAQLAPPSPLVPRGTSTNRSCAVVPRGTAEPPGRRSPGCRRLTTQALRPGRGPTPGERLRAPRATPSIGPPAHGSCTLHGRTPTSRGHEPQVLDPHDGHAARGDLVPPRANPTPRSSRRRERPVRRTARSAPPPPPAAPGGDRPLRQRPPAQLTPGRPPANGKIRRTYVRHPSAPLRMAEAQVTGERPGAVN